MSGNVIDSVIVLATVATVMLVASHQIVFGSERGKWVFFYVRHAKADLVMLAVLAAPLIAVLHEVARRFVVLRPITVVSASLVAGTGLQILLRRLYPYRMSDMVVSDSVNGFYSAAGRVGALELLRDFDSVVQQFTLHARVNMPGKVLFYQALRSMTTDPQSLAVIITLLSSLAGVVLYGLVARAFGNRQLALDAMTLWMLVPARISFLPVLNVVSALPAIAAAWCLTRHLDVRSRWTPPALGGLVYLTALFDPLALWLCVAFSPLVIGALAARRLSFRELLALASLALGSLVAFYLVVRALTGFDIWRRFLQMATIVREFNVEWGRTYSVWVGANAKDVALAVGPAVAVLFLWAVVRAVYLIGRTPSGSSRWQTGPLISIGAFVALAALVAIGLNRGEVARLWLPLFLPMQVAVAWSASEIHPRTRHLLIAATVLYGAVTVGTVGYCVG